MHPSYSAQIALLLVDEALVKISRKYANYANMFSYEIVAKLSKYIKINDNSMNLKENKQLP